MSKKENHSSGEQSPNLYFLQLLLRLYLKIASLLKISADDQRRTLQDAAQSVDQRLLPNPFIETPVKDTRKLEAYINFNNSGITITDVDRTSVEDVFFRDDELNRLFMRIWDSTLPLIFNTEIEIKKVLDLINKAKLQNEGSSLIRIRATYARHIDFQQGKRQLSVQIDKKNPLQNPKDLFPLISTVQDLYVLYFNSRNASNILVKRNNGEVHIENSNSYISVPLDFTSELLIILLEEMFDSQKKENVFEVRDLLVSIIGDNFDESQTAVDLKRTIIEAVNQINGIFAQLGLNIELTHDGKSVSEFSDLSPKAQFNDIFTSKIKLTVK